MTMPAVTEKTKMMKTATTSSNFIASFAIRVLHTAQHLEDIYRRPTQARVLPITTRNKSERQES